MERSKIADPKTHSRKIYEATLAQIAFVRKSKKPKLTQKEMSLLLEIDHASYNRIESGSQALNLERFFEICCYLDVEPKGVLGLDVG